MYATDVLWLLEFCPNVQSESLLAGRSKHSRRDVAAFDSLDLLWETTEKRLCRQTPGAFEMVIFLYLKTYTDSIAVTTFFPRERNED